MREKMNRKRKRMIIMNLKTEIRRIVIKIIIPENFLRK